MKLDNLLNKMINEQEITKVEYHQLINYVDNSQDWNLQLMFQTLCRHLYLSNFACMSAKAILDQLIEEESITVDNN